MVEGGIRPSGLLLATCVLRRLTNSFYQDLESIEALNVLGNFQVISGPSGKQTILYNSETGSSALSLWSFLFYSQTLALPSGVTD